MKRKQKKVMMTVTGVAAVILCALKLGPLLAGAPLTDQPPSSSGKPGTAKPAPKTTTPAGGTAHAAPRPTAPARAPTVKKPTRAAATAEPPQAELLTLSVDQVDLSAIGPRHFDFDWRVVRDPFAPAAFEAGHLADMAALANLRLAGVLAAGDLRLAIIGNRVYREGQEVVRGVTLLTVGDAEVVLSDGARQVRLPIVAPGAAGRKQ